MRPRGTAREGLPGREDRGRRGRPSRRAAALTLALGLTPLAGACTPDGLPDRTATAAEAGTLAGATAAPPERFGTGSPASAAAIAAWDIDVRSDGAGLPPGSGTVAQGEAVYAANCAACHGPTGVEGPNDRLVGREPRDGFPFGAERGLTKTVGNYWPYATTLYDYINRTMPMDRPGVLTPDQIYAVVAWILNRNEIIPADAVMDANTLPAVVMPARDRFVVDDRQGGPRVR